MKLIWAIFALLVSAIAPAQKLSQDDLKTLIPYLQKEDYRGAFEHSKKLLDDAPADTGDARAQIAYINIYASAGLVTQNQMNRHDFKNNTLKFVGQKLKMPGHPCVADTVKVAFNSFQFLRDNDRTKGFTMTANQKRTNILLFEYYNFEQAPDPKDFVGNTVRTTGILESFEMSPETSTTWVVRLQFAHPNVNLFIPN